MTAPAAAVERSLEPVVSGTSEWRIVLDRLLKKRLAMVSIVIIGVIYGAGILAPVLAPYPPTQIAIARPVEGPSRDHLLGTDRLGRDELSRAMYSSRTTLIVTTAVLLSGGLIIGNTLGLLAGYRGGWVDMLVMRTGDVFSSLPALVMLILINATLGPRVVSWTRWVEGHTPFHGLVASGFPSYMLVFSALSLFFWVGTARVIRSQVLQLRERDYIMAAESLGASPTRVILQHLLPNVSFLIILSLSATLGGIAGSEIVLTWFGVGVQPPAASFGAMLSEGTGTRTFHTSPHLLLVPGTIVTLLLFAFALLGDALNDAIRRR